LIYSQIWLHGIRDDRQLFYNFVWIIANLATNKNIGPQERRKAEWVQSHKKARLVGADWEQLRTVEKKLGTSREVESRTKEADMAIGVCRQCLVYMATHTRLRTTACSTTPARVRSTAPRAHTLPVPSRTAPCTLPVLSRISSPLLPCARHALVRRRHCRFAASLPSVAPFALHCSPSVARPLLRCIPSSRLHRCCAMPA
jgi:hypothetical protein